MINDRQRSQVGCLTGGMLLVLGLLVTPVGLLGFLGEGFTGIGMVLLVLAIGGILMLYGGWQQWTAARKLRRDELHLQSELMAAKPASQTVSGLPSSPSSTQTLLAQYTVDTETWQTFKKNEIRYRNSDNIYFFIGIVLLGTPFLMFARSTGWPVALAFSACIGLITVLLRRQLSLQKLKTRAAATTGSVVIADGFVVLNGHTFDLYSNNRHTTRVRFLPEENPPILEFTIAWITRKGRTFDELRVPVPKHLHQEALNIAKHFNNK